MDKETFYKRLSFWVLVLFSLSALLAAVSQYYSSKGMEIAIDNVNRGQNVLDDRIRTLNPSENMTALKDDANKVQKDVVKYRAIFHTEMMWSRIFYILSIMSFIVGVIFYIPSFKQYEKEKIENNNLRENVERKTAENSILISKIEKQKYKIKELKLKMEPLQIKKEKIT